MKKCLITGGAGTVGVPLINELLKTNKYEITVVDLKSPKSIKRLKSFESKIKIVYTDISDSKLMQELICQNDIIYHLAGILPPNAIVNTPLLKDVDYTSTINIIDMIKKYNPKAYFIYLSSTTIYQKVLKVNKTTPVHVLKEDTYSLTKLEIEEYIKENLKNYTIYQTPLILDSNTFEHFMYNLEKNKNIELITNDMVAVALKNTLSNKKELLKRTYILSGGKKYVINTSLLLKSILSINGISGRFFLMRYLLPCKFYVQTYDTKEINKILKFQQGDIKDYLNQIKKLKKSRRFIQRFIAKLFFKNI